MGRELRFLNFTKIFVSILILVSAACKKAPTLDNAPTAPSPSTPAPNKYLLFVTEPSSSANAGVKFGTQPIVEVRNEDGSLNTSSTDSITITAHTDPSCLVSASGTLQAPSNPINASAGVANTFNLDYTKAETIYLKASAASLTSDCSALIDVDPGNPSATTSTIVSDGNIVAANNYHKGNVVITLLDDYSNPISGTVPTFTATDSGSTNSYDVCSVTDALGVSNCTMDSSGVEVKTLSLQTPIVKVDGTINFVEPPVSGNTTIVGTSAVADLLDSSTITIALRDQFNAPVPGFVPEFSATDTGTTNVQGTCSVSDAAGQSTCGLLSTYAEVKTLTINQPLSMVGGSATFIAGPPVATNSNITGTTNVIADGVATSTITITLRDQYNNPKSGETPTFSATGTTNGYGTCSVSNAAGQSTCTLTSTVAETKVLSITAPVAKTDGSMTFIPGPAAQLTYTQQPSTNGIAGVDLTQQPHVQIADANGNIRNTDTSGITLTAHINATCTIAAPGTLGANSNPQNANGTNGTAVFSGVDYNLIGIIYLKAELSGVEVCSNSINITPAPATKVVFIQDPTNAQAGNNISPSITVEIRDTFDNVVNSTDNVTLAIGNNPSSGTLNGTLTVAAVAGTATFSNINIEEAGVGYDLVASSGSLTTDTSNSFNITAGPKNKVVFIQDPTDAVFDTAISPAITVEIQDTYGNITNDTDNVTLAINNNPSGGTLSGTLTVAAVSGTATFSTIQIDNVGVAYTLDATSGGLASDTSNSFNITVGPATKVVFVQDPTDANAGDNISPAITVEIRDSGDNLVSSTDNVTLAINNNPGSGTLSGTLTVAAVGGVATFSDINIDKMGTGYTLDATSGSLTSDTSNSFNISPNTKDRVVFTTQPTDANANIAIAPAIVVEIQDAYGNVTADTDNVTLAINNNPSGGTLSGSLTVAAVAGVATFSDISIDMAGTSYDLDATSGGLTSATSDPFDINAAVATKVVFIQQPTDTQSVTNISPAITVELRDAGDNLVSSTDNVTLAIGTNPGSGTLSGTLTVAAVAGVATFSDIQIDKVGINYDLIASSGSLTTDTSDPFDITIGPKTQVVFNQQPVDTASGDNITPAMTVEIQDAGGNRTSDTDNITLAIGNNPSAGVLSGTLTIAAVNGTATFSDINIDKVGTDYDLVASSGGLTTDTSDAFDITAGTPAKVVFITDPTSTTSMTDVTPSIVAHILDANDNLTGSTANVTLSINNDPSVGATLFGTTTKAAVAGVATFDDIQIDKIGTGFTLDVTSSGLSSDTSDAFNISVGPKSQLVYTQEPTDAQAGVSISPAITVAIQDAGGNTTADTDNITLSFGNDPSTGTASLSGTLTVAAIAGVATFSNISLDVMETGYTLNATSSGVPVKESASFNISAGTKAKLVIIDEPTDTGAGINIAPAITVEIQDAFGNKTSDTDTVNIAIDNNPSGGTLSGTTGVAAVAGTATFSNLNIDNVGTGYTLVVSSGGLTTDTSNSFNIYTTPTQLVFTVHPSDTEIGNNISPAIQVEVRDASNVLVTDFTDNVTIALNADPSSGSATLSGTLTVAAIGGVATFSGLSLDEVYANYSLQATSSGLTNGISNLFDYILPPPTGITLVTPGSSPSVVATPTVQVAGVESGDIVKLFTDASCSTQVASYTASGTTVDMTTSYLSDGSYNFYANRTATTGSTSACSTATLAYQVLGSFEQLDDMATLGNWSNVGGDDRDWSLNSGDTPSNGIGPTSGAGGSGNYAYTEASSPVAANEEFILESNTLDGATYDLYFSFKWNKRGDNMGDLYLEASDDDGSTWTSIWSHLGSDIATSGTDVWREQGLDVCTLGYTTATTKFRFRAVMPASGNVWNSDIAVDDLHVTSGGCSPAPPATVAITTPSAGGQVNLLNHTSFAVSGTCSDNGQNVILSGDVAGTTTCSSNAWSFNLDLSGHANGSINIIANHSSAGGGANGTDSVSVTKDTSVIFSDDFETGFGNWIQDSGDDRDWSTNSGNTPSNNVGPTGAQGGTQYIYTEASNPVQANDEFIIYSPTIDIDTLAVDVNVSFYWNKRGNNMGDLYMEVSDDGGSTWNTEWSHLGADIATGGTNTWNAQQVDLCNVGYTSGDIIIRFRAVMPASGSVWNSDIALDTIDVLNNGCP